MITTKIIYDRKKKAVRLSKLFEKKAEEIYNLTMSELLDDEDDLDD